MALSKAMIDEWAAAQQRPCVPISSAEPDALMRGIAAVCDDDPDEHLSRRWGYRRAGPKTAFEWRTFFQARDDGADFPAGDSDSNLLEQALRPWLETRDAEATISASELAQALEAGLSSPNDRWIAVWELAARDRKPVFAQIGGDPRFLAEIVERQPAASAVWLAEADAWTTLIQRDPHSRLAALLLESRIVIEDPAAQPRSLAQPTDGKTVGPAPPADVNINIRINIDIELRLGETAQSLSAALKKFGGAIDAESERLRNEAWEAIATRSSRDQAGDPDPRLDDGARSAAERLLFRCLEALPETAGLFRLNDTIDCMFGPRLMEIDLAASSLRLAIELDGYHHFRSHDNYRRDRRKDLELQLRDWLVLRFLSDDVASRSETVLETILNAVRQRKSMTL